VKTEKSLASQVAERTNKQTEERKKERLVSKVFFSLSLSLKRVRSKTDRKKKEQERSTLTLSQEGAIEKRGRNKHLSLSLSHPTTKNEASSNIGGVQQKFEN
jgi:hypothetical protein